jgi:hypothetical protein
MLHSHCQPSLLTAFSELQLFRLPVFYIPPSPEAFLLFAPIQPTPQIYLIPSFQPGCAQLLSPEILTLHGTFSTFPYFTPHSCKHKQQCCIPITSPISHPCSSPFLACSSSAFLSSTYLLPQKPSYCLRQFSRYHRHTSFQHFSQAANSCHHQQSQLCMALHRLLPPTFAASGNTADGTLVHSPPSLHTEYDINSTHVTCNLHINCRYYSLTHPSSRTPQHLNRQPFMLRGQTSAASRPNLPSHISFTSGSRLQR